MRHPLKELHLGLPGSWRVSLLAALTTWLTLLTWSPFAEVSSTYLKPILGACLLVAVSGMLLRAARLPAVVVLLVQALVLLLWLHHMWSGGQAWWGLFPTSGSLHHVLHTLSASMAAAQAYASPIPRSVTTFAPMMVVAGACTALLVDFLACGLRRAPLAGLPLLAVYTAPVSILDGGVPWAKFAAAALSFLFLIAADEAQRLTHWGHQLSGAGRLLDTQSSRVSAGSVWSSARKIGFTVTGLAVVIPLFVPTLSADLFTGNGSGRGAGKGAVSISNPMVDLKRDLVRGRDVPLVQVTTTDPDPSYLRISVLDDFDGEAWRPSGRDIPVDHRADGPVSRPPGLLTNVATRAVTWSITADRNFTSRWLPAPYPVRSIKAPGDWRYDSSTLDFISAADGQTTAGLSYSLRALQVDPTAKQLSDAGPVPASVYVPGTALPRELPASVRSLARRLTRGLTDRFSMAVRLQQWFRTDGGFTYSLQHAPGNGLSALVHFLGTGPGSRTGYCEQFAAAMALLGRTLGIPSRVAVGFLHPHRIGPNRYSYSSHDLHAWPEMYFEGVGWVRFEPTPASHTGGVPAYTVRPLSESKTTAAPLPSRPAQTRNKFDNPAERPTPVAAAGGGRHGGGPTGPLIGIGVLLLLVLLLLVPRGARTWLRRRRWAAAGSPAEIAEAAWAELRATALDLGQMWDDHVTLRTRARDLSRSFGRAGHHDALGRGAWRGADADPEATDALDRLVRRLERARFARSMPAEDGLRDQVAADLDRCVAALRAGASRRSVTRATWLPVSLLRGLRPARSGAATGERRPLSAQPGVDHAV
ncbi:MAG: transglutaminase family protein [Nocardioidaceae bacterium]